MKQTHKAALDTDHHPEAHQDMEFADAPRPSHRAKPKTHANRWLLVRIHEDNDHFQYARLSKSGGLTWVSKKNAPGVLKFRDRRDAFRYLARITFFRTHGEFLALEAVAITPEDEATLLRALARS